MRDVSAAIGVVRWATKTACPDCHSHPGGSHPNEEQSARNSPIGLTASLPVGPRLVDGYNVELDELDQHHVVLVMRALRLIVLGRTLGEAQQLARAAIASHSQEMAGAGSQTAASRVYDYAIAASIEAPDTSRGRTRHFLCRMTRYREPHLSTAPSRQRWFNPCLLSSRCIEDIGRGRRYDARNLDDPGYRLVRSAERLR